MSRLRLKSVAVQIGMLSVLTILVVVLTVLFNLVGALCFSIAAGMMAGASRRWNWQVIIISLMPPVAALVLGHLTKVDFDLRKGISLIAICLGSFWGTWLATYLMMLLEAKSGPEPASAQTPTPTKSQEPDVEFKLDDLQGTWLCESDRAGDISKRRLLTVERGRFSLRIAVADGSSRLVAEGDVLLRGVDGHKKLVLVANAETKTRESDEA